jgi:hypothetical protein
MSEQPNDETRMIDEVAAMEMILAYDRDIGKAEDFNKLLENKSFQSLIMEGYLKQEALRLTSLLAVAPPNDKPKIIDDLYAISAFSAFLSSLTANAHQATSNKSAIQEALTEMTSENHNDDPRG